MRACDSISQMLYVEKLLKDFFFEHIMWFIYLVTEIIPSEHLITPLAVSATEVQ